MTRTDSTMAPAGDDREVLRKEVRSEMRNEEGRRRRRGCCGCLVLGLIPLLLAFVFIGVPLAKSGLVYMPVLTTMYVKPNEPLRKVLPLAGSTPQQIASMLPLRSQFDQRTSLLAIPVKEEELTTFAQDFVLHVQPEQLLFPVRSIQLAVAKDYVEAHAVIVTKDGRDVDERFRFRPVMRAGTIDVEVVEALSGSYEVPGWIANGLFDALFTGAVASAQTQLSTIGQLTEIRLDDKQVTFVFFHR